MERARPRARAGALVVLATCFVASALVRVGEVVAALPEPSTEESLVNEPPSDAADSASGDGLGDVRAPAEVVAELRRQRDALDRREADVTEREQRLAAISKRLADRLEELKAARERLRETAALVDDAAGKDVRRLALMYSQMKPKQAGQIFDRMAPSFAAGFLTEMRPEAAALILANMAADKAYAVSLLMAGRNVDRPDHAAPRAAEE